MANNRAADPSHLDFSILEASSNDTERAADPSDARFQWPREVKKRPATGLPTPVILYINGLEAPNNGRQPGCRGMYRQGLT